MVEIKTHNYSTELSTKDSNLIDHKSIESGSEKSDLSDLTDKQKQIREKLLSVLDELKESFQTYGSDFEEEDIGALKEFLDVQDSQDLKKVLNFQNENGMTILHDVAEFYDGVTELLLNGGANPNIPDNAGKTPLQVAINYRCYGAIGLFFDDKLKRSSDKQRELNKELLGLLDDINYVSTRQKFDSEYKVDNDKIAALKKFLDYHKKENSEDLKIVLNLPRGKLGSTILHNTQSLFYTETLSLLLGAGADLNVQDIEGKTPLHIAAQYGYQESAKLLLKKGADPNAKDMDGNTPFRLTIMDESLDIVQFFLENNETDINLVHERTGESPIFDAVESKGNSTNILDLMIKSGKKIDFNISNENGVTILHRAAFIGQRSMIQLLLEQGANVSAVDSEGNNPLHYIIYNNHKFYGADNKDEEREFDYDNGENIIAMISSFVSCHVKDLTALINEKVEEWFKEIDKEARAQLQREIYSLELEREVKVKEYVNTKNQNDNTPLFFAIESGNHDVINTLLEKGAIVKVTDKNGYTPYHYTVKNKDPKILKLLSITPWERGEIINHIQHALMRNNSQEFSNLDNFVKQYNCLDMATYITEKVLPSISHKDNNEKFIGNIIDTIFPNYMKDDRESYEAIKTHVSKIIMLVVEETKTRLSVLDEEGNTLLHHAVKWGCGEEILDFLVSSGMDVNAKNKHGVAPIHIAAKYGKASQMEFFIRNEADLNVQCGNFTKADTEILENNFIIANSN